jgi:putative Holliday junction resolvase
MTSSSSKQPPGRIAGIDYGTVRVGIALSDPERILASPSENYTRRGEKQDAKRMQQLVEEDGVVLFVVGLPVHLDGRESQKSIEAREYGAWITEVTGVAVEFFDERFTSSEAERYLIDARMTSKRRKKRLDMIAAQIMLSAYLESHSPNQSNPGSLDD